jgi:hypothetical protein
MTPDNVVAIALAALKKVKGLEQTDAYVNEQGHLMLTTALGDVIDAGRVVGTAGKDGKDGQDGKDGESIQGPPGRDGKDGKSIKGDKGDKGDSIQGRPGKDGLDGTDGKDGADGKDGVDGKEGKAGQSIKGDQGETGPAPEHKWDGTALKFKKPDGKWGKAVDLQGPRGAGGGSSASSGTGSFVVYSQAITGYLVTVLPTTHMITNVVGAEVRNALGKRVLIGYSVVAGVVTLEANVNLSGCTLTIFGE